MSFIQPGLGDVHVDRPLTNISLAFLQDQTRFIADRVFPRVGVDAQSNKYFTYDRGAFNRDEMEQRAPGTESAGVTYTQSQDSYSCDVFALHANIADQVRANADSPIQLDREAVELLTVKSLIQREVAWASQYFTSGQWTTDVDGVSGAPSDDTEVQQFNEAASTPIEVIDGAKCLVQESTGFDPNVLVMGKKVYNTLKNHPDIVARLDRGQTSGPAMALRANLAALFEVDEILVMESIQNTAAEGAANVHSFIGGKHMLLAYRAPSPGIMTPSAGYTFTWNGLLGGGGFSNRITKMRAPLLKSDRVEIESAYDHKLVSADLGYFFNGVIA